MPYQNVRRNFFQFPARTYDAKTCSGNTFALDLIEPHQMEFLRQRHRCKIIAGVMVLMAKFNRVYFVPFDYLDKRQTLLQMQTGKRAKPGTASLSLSDFEANAIEITKHKTNSNWDWLPRLVAG
jgi:penicillin-binding protein-related factor A (putative recombinase)